MNKNLIRCQTVILIGKILHPLTESNLIPFPEYREIIAQLKHIAAKGDPLPPLQHGSKTALIAFICRKIAKKPQLPHKKQPTATLGKYPSGSPDFHDNLCYDIGNAVSNLSVILHPWR